MMKRVKQEIDYRLSKWLIWNAGIEQILTSDETENVFRKLLSFYDPPTRCVERVQSMHDRKSDTASFKHKTVCGLCGKNYGTKTWHCNDRVWSCRERGITGHTCQNSQVYDYAFQQMIKRSLLLLLPDRTGIGKECERLVRRYVYDKSRLRNAVKYIRTFAESDTTTIELGDEAGFIVEWLTGKSSGAVTPSMARRPTSAKRRTSPRRRSKQHS